MKNLSYNNMKYFMISVAKFEKKKKWWNGQLKLSKELDCLI